MKGGLKAATSSVKLQRGDKACRALANLPRKDEVDARHNRIPYRAMIIATGVDIVETARIRELMCNDRTSFLQRWFSDAEISYCEKMADPPQHYAARFAAKEATVKVLGIRWDRPICWSDISVSRTDSGGPTIEISGFAFQAMKQKGITAVHISLSHTREYAVASVIAEGRPDSASLGR